MQRDAEVFQGAAPIDKEDLSMELKSQVGETAGAVYRLLEKEGALTTAQLKKKLNSKGDLLSYALGWLAREDKIDFIPEKKTLKVQLR
jgi:hypothetical protein